MKRLLAVLVLVTLSLSGVTPASAALRLQLGANPITLPDRDNLGDCSYTTLSVKRSDKKAFGSLSSLTLETSIEAGEIALNSALQRTNEVGKLTIFGEPSLPKTTHLAVRLCTLELPEFDPTFLWAHVTLDNSKGDKIAYAKIKIPIVQPTGVTSSAKSLMSECKIGPDYEGFGTNFVLEVTKLQLIYDYYTERLIGASVSLQGTMIREGLLADKEKVTIVPSGQTRALTSTTTDSKGQFKLSFNVSRSGFSSNGDSVSIRVGSKLRQIGDQRIIQASASEWISFDWLLYPGISSLPGSSWTPVLTEDCLNANAVFAGNKDDKNRGRHLLYAAALKLWGTSKAKSSENPKNTESNRFSPNKSGAYKENMTSKKTYSKSFSGSSGSSSDSRVNGGTSSGGGSGINSGRCWVNGYTTKTGKRVSGYFRRC